MTVASDNGMLLPQSSAQGDVINEKSRSGRPAKIVPPRFPEEARNSPIPRCAMQTGKSDHQKLELGESQEGL
jgi:hypothetical protein